MYEAWENRLHYAVSNYPGSGYACQFTLPWLPGMALDFRDIRATDEKGLKLSYWIESYTTSSAVVWVLLGATKSFYIHYGNGAAVSESNGKAVFTMLFDDFTSVDTTLWTYPSSYYTVSNSILTLSVPATYGDYELKTKSLVSNTVSIRARVKTLHSGVYSGAYERPVGVVNSYESFVSGTEGGSPAPRLQATSSSSALSGWAANTWLITELKRKGTAGTSCTVNGTLYSLSNYATESEYVRIRCISQSAASVTSQLSVDWICARPYLSTEPTATLLSGGYRNVNGAVVALLANTPNLFEFNIPKLRMLVERQWVRTGLDTTAHDGQPASKSTEYRDWPEVVKYRIDNYPGSGYICIFNLTWKPGMRADFRDIRFSDNTGRSLPLYIESYTYASAAKAWVKLGSSNIVYLHYGNPSAISASNGDNVFILFDDFNGVSSSKWTTVSGTVSASNSILSMTPASTSVQAIIRSVNSILWNNVVVESKMKVDSNNRVNFGSSYTRSFLYDDGTTWYIFNDSTETSVATGSATAPTTGVYGTAKVVYTSSAVTGYWNGTQIVTTTNVDLNNRLLNLRHWYQGTANWDWIRVYKYVATDPVPVIIGSNRVFDPAKAYSVMRQWAAYTREASVNVPAIGTKGIAGSWRGSEADFNVPAIEIEAVWDGTYQRHRPVDVQVPGINVRVSIGSEWERTAQMSVPNPCTSVGYGDDYEETVLCEVTPLAIKVDRVVHSGRVASVETAVSEKTVRTNHVERPASVSVTPPDVVGSRAVHSTRESDVYIPILETFSVRLLMKYRDASVSVQPPYTDDARVLHSERPVLCAVPAAIQAAPIFTFARELLMTAGVPSTAVNRLLAFEPRTADMTLQGVKQTAVRLQTLARDVLMEVKPGDVDVVHLGPELSRPILHSIPIIETGVQAQTSLIRAVDLPVPASDLSIDRDLSLDPREASVFVNAPVIKAWEGNGFIRAVDVVVPAVSVIAAAQLALDRDVQVSAVIEMFTGPACSMERDAVIHVTGPSVLVEKDQAHSREIVECLVPAPSVEVDVSIALVRTVQANVPPVKTVAGNWHELTEPVEIEITRLPYTASITKLKYNCEIETLSYRVETWSIHMLEITAYDTETIYGTLYDTDPFTLEQRLMPLDDKTVSLILKGGTPTKTIEVPSVVLGPGKVQTDLNSTDSTVTGVYTMKYLVVGPGFRKELPEKRSEVEKLRINDATKPEA